MGAAQQSTGPAPRRRALTFKRLRGAISASKLGVDDELELLHRVVVLGVGRTRKRVHDPGPVVDAPAVRHTARAHKSEPASNKPCIP